MYHGLLQEQPPSGQARSLKSTSHKIFLPATVRMPPNHVLQHSRLQTPSKHGQALPLRRVSLRESVIPTARQTITPNVSSTQQIAASFLLTQLTLLISEMNGRFVAFLTMASCLLTLPTTSLTSDIEAFQHRSCCINTTYVVKSPSTTNSPCSHYVSR